MLIRSMLSFNLKTEMGTSFFIALIASTHHLAGRNLRFSLLLFYSVFQTRELLQSRGQMPDTSPPLHFTIDEWATYMFLVPASSHIGKQKDNNLREPIFEPACKSISHRTVCLVSTVCSDRMIGQFSGHNIRMTVIPKSFHPVLPHHPVIPSSS